MEEGKKKMIMVAIIVVCIVAAVVITVATRSGSTGGIESINIREMVWLKCRNPKCENEWQMGKRAYFEYLEKHRDPTVMAAAPIVCPKCGEKSGYRAEKCEKCGFVFERGSVPNEVADKCPKCGYSATEEARK
jgi:ribosomal protein L40E